MNTAATTTAPQSSELTSLHLEAVLAAVLAALKDGPKNLAEIDRRICADWRGAVVPQATVQALLFEAEDAGAVRRTATGRWERTERTIELDAESNGRAQSLADRFETQVGDLARELGYSLDAGTLKTWTSILIEVLHCGISTPFGANPQEIRSTAGRLRPPFDHFALERAIAERAHDSAAQQALRTLAVTALDPSSVFGSELVHVLTVGYSLHLVLIGAAAVVDPAMAPSLILLDTPILMMLLRNDDVSRAALDLVGRVATAAGAQVAVATCTFDEFGAVVSAHVGEAMRIEKSIRRGMSRESLAVATTDTLIACWLRTGLSWADFEKRVEGLSSVLGAIGVDVEFCAPMDDGQHGFEEALRQSIESRGSRERTPHAIAHDDRLLRAVHSERSMCSAGPGAFVVTSDRAMNGAYSAIDPDDGIPVAVSLGQLLGVLSPLLGPADQADAALAIAQDFQFEARLAVVANYGPDDAARFASVIHSETPDAQVAAAVEIDLSLRGAERGWEPTEALDHLFARREERLRKARQEDLRRAQLEVVEAKRERATTQQRNLQLQAESAQYEDRESDTTAALHRQMRRSRRLWIAIWYLLTLVLMVGLRLAGMLSVLSILLALVGLLVALAPCVRWSRDLTEPASQLVLRAVSGSAALLFAEILGRFISRA